MDAFTNLIQCGEVEGGDGVRVDSCSGPAVVARSRVGPSIKFRGFGDCLSCATRLANIQSS